MCANFHTVSYPGASLNIVAGIEFNSGKLKVKKIIIKSCGQTVVLVSLLGLSGISSAGVFEQLAAVANSALPAYGRVQTMSPRPELKDHQIESAIRQALRLAADRTVQIEDDTLTLSADLRRAKKAAVKLGHGQSFELLTRQIEEVVIAAAPGTAALFKEALELVEFDKPRQLLEAHDAAATDYLRHRVAVKLQRQLQPVVEDLLQQSGASDVSAQIAEKIKYGNLLEIMISDHVIQRSVDGFFRHLEVQEKAIRHSPDHQSTNLLRHVFG